MPLFDRDPNFEEHFQVGDRFVLTNLEYTGSIRTRLGSAERTTVTAVTRESYPSQRRFSVLGIGFKNMAEAAEPGDYPVVVEYVRVKLDERRDVKRLARVMNGEDPLSPRDFIHERIDGDPIDMAQFDSPESAPVESAGGGPGF